MEITRIDGLEIDQDLEFQRRSWVFQRVGWAVMGLVVLAAVVGLLGSGPLSRARAELPGRMTVEYQRFARFETTASLTIRLQAEATAGDAVHVSLNHAFLTSAKIEDIQPPPTRVEARAERYVYVFDVAEPRVPMLVTFTFQPRRVGASPGMVGLESAPGPRHVSFRQLVYP